MWMQSCFVNIWSVGIAFKKFDFVNSFIIILVKFQHIQVGKKQDEK